MSLITALARPEILALEPYAHAAWDPALERLHANENPWRFPGDRSHAGLNRYPEPHPYALEASLARLYGVAPDRLIAGRGSDEGIDLLVRAFCVPGQDAVLICPPTFGMYAVAARIQGAAVVEVPLDRERGFALDEAAIEAALAAMVKLVFICNPNNPTGNALDAGAIGRLARKLEHRALVVVDEAYGEFAQQPSMIARLEEMPNLVVLRTLSKAYALAGARCGALLGAASLVALLRHIIPPYATTTETIEAVAAALEPGNFAVARQRIALLRDERARLAGALAAVAGVRRVWPSEANFLLVEARDAPALVARARAGGFLLRDFSRGRHTPDSLRISIGTPDQNDRLIAALAAR